MTFALTPAAPYVNGTGVVNDTDLNYWRSAIHQAVDGAGGGSYSPSAQLVFSGAGLKLSGVTALELDATSICTQDVGGVFNFGGTVNIVPAGLLEINALGFLLVQSGGNLIVQSGGTATVQSGGLLTVSAGGSETVYGALTVEPDGGIVWGGTSGHPGTAIWQNHSTALFQSGSTVTANAGSAINVSGTLEVKTGGLLQTDSGSTGTFDGATTISNLVSTTQTGPFLKSGTTATTGLRFGGPGTTDANNTFDPTQWDIIPCDNGGVAFGAARTWKFTAPGGGVSCARVTCSAQIIGAVVGGGNAITFQNSVGATIAHMAGSAGAWSYMDFMWTAATDWMPLGSGGAFAPH